VTCEFSDEENAGWNAQFGSEKGYKGRNKTRYFFDPAIEFRKMLINKTFEPFSLTGRS
jgi:hypothetical protein